MKTAFSNISNMASAIDLNSLKLNDDLERMLLFVSEICNVEYAFITLADTEGHSIKSKIGLEGLSNPSDILGFKELIVGKEDLIVSDFKKDSKFQLSDSSDSSDSFDFFAGFPINIPDSLIAGTLCILNKRPKELSSIELKTLKQTVAQIESLLELHLENKSLQDTVYQDENKFHLFIKNSLEIFYLMDLNGNVTYVSKNWTNLLGHCNEEVLGRNFTEYIHPDDVDSCLVYLGNIAQKTIGKKEHSYRIRNKDGHYVWFSCKIGLLENKKGTFYIGASREITEYVEGQNKLILQKEFYEKILNGLPTGVVVIDSDFRYIYLNPTAIKNDELRQFIIGKNDLEYAKRTNRDETFAIERTDKYEKAILKKKTIIWEEEFYDTSDQMYYHKRIITPLFRNDGTLDMLIGFGLDITESKNAQIEVLKSKQLTSNIIKNAGVGILVQGPQSEILENNDSACQMLGLTQDQLLGKISFDEQWNVIHLDGSSFKAEDHPVPRAIKELKPLNNIVMGVHRPVTNDLVWLLVNAIPVFGDDDELIYVICSFSDITTQKTAENALKISNERFEYARKATSDLMWDWDIETGEVFTGGRGPSQFGYKFENNMLKISDSINLVHPDDRDYCYKSIEKSFEKGESSWSDEYRYLKSDGTYAYVKDRAVIIRNAYGKAIRMVGAMQDITYEKKLKDELTQSEEQFKGAFEYSSIGMAIVDFISFKWCLVNSKLVEILGYSREELNKMTFVDVTHPDDKAEDLVNLVLMSNGYISNYAREKRYIHKNGSIVWGQLSVSLVKDNLGQSIHFVSQIVDITLKKRVEEENELLIEENNKKKTVQLNEAKGMYRLLADNMVDLVCLHSMDAKLKYVSPSVNGIFGYFPEDLVGLSPIDYVHPEDLKTLQKKILGFIARKKKMVVQVRFRNKKGKYIWCEVKVKFVKENGEPASFHTSTRDITQAKKAKLAVKKALNKERQLNELRTNLVSTISHEFRTPMSTIRASADLIQMYLKDQIIENFPLLQNRIDIIKGEIDRIIDLMNSVLVISKNDLGKTNFAPVNLDLKQICLKVIGLDDFDHKEGRKIKMVSKGDAFPVFADKKLMEYILINLLANGFKYSKGCGDVILNLFTTQDVVVVEVIDFGIGIPEEDQEKLFNTFYRASNTNGISGTGLGLYIVKTFTEMNSGSIELESKLGEGTKVTLQFPIPKTIDLSLIDDKTVVVI